MEDHADTSDMLRRLFEARGYCIDLASTPEEALVRAAGNRYDALICDIGLPGMSGLELLPALRRLSSAPAVAFSAHARDVDKAASRAAFWSPPSCRRTGRGTQHHAQLQPVGLAPW